VSALDAFADEPRWIAWRNETRNVKATKVPYAPQGGKAKADDPATWGIRVAAEARAAKIVNGTGGGIGIQLGDLDANKLLGGIDLDSCIVDDGTIAPWAAAILSAVPTYAEKSPSGRGIKLFFYIASEAARPFLDRLGVKPDSWGCRRAAPGEDARNHGPAVQLYLARRYFAVTNNQWPGAPDKITGLDGAGLDRLAGVIPAKTEVTVEAAGNGKGDASRSAIAFRLGLKMYRSGKTFDDFVKVVRTDPETVAWHDEKGTSTTTASCAASGKRLSLRRTVNVGSIFYARRISSRSRYGGFGRVGSHAARSRSLPATPESENRNSHSPSLPSLRPPASSRWTAPAPSGDR
jgi:putative DNA primase/helicase